MSSGSTKRKDEESITGQARKVTFMKVSLKLVRETARELSGGLTAAGMKVTSETEYSLDGESSTEKEDTGNTKATGIMECLMAKELSTSRTDKGTKALSRKTNSTEKASSTRTIRSSMEFGKTMSFQWLTWSRAVLEKNDDPRYDP